MEYSITILQVTRGNEVQYPRPCTSDLGSMHETYIRAEQLEAKHVQLYT